MSFLLRMRSSMCVFLLVGQFETVAAEDLEPVVLVGVVGSGNHDAGIGAHALGDKGDAGGGQHADQIGVASHGGDTGLEGAFQHVPGNAGVLPDDHPGAVAVLSEHVRHGLTDAEGDLRAHGVPVCLTPYPIGSK